MRQTTRKDDSGPVTVRQLQVQRELVRYWSRRAQRAEEAGEALVSREEALVRELVECVPAGSRAAEVLARYGVVVPVPQSGEVNAAVLAAEVRAFEESRRVAVAPQA